MHMSYHYHFISGVSAVLASQHFSVDKSTGAVSFPRTERRSKLHCSNCIGLCRTKKHILLVKISHACAEFALKMLCMHSSSVSENAIRVTNTRNSMLFFSSSCSTAARTSCGEREHPPSASQTMLESRVPSCS